ncbi:MAG TPA: molybdopterin containing oxidoreductase, partial [Saprospiraceae bacterium]|nr:molybdopterin containing oxidoreductase [Saprospiraceae bacterium]
MQRKKVGIRTLYAKDPIKADELLWGRIANKDRRGFLKNMGLLSMGAALGAPMVFADFFPAGMIPAGLLNEDTAFALP